jgi:hypothetical protein
MVTAASAHQAGSFETRVSSDRATLTLLMTGRLDANTTGRLWREAQHIFDQSKTIRVVIDASQVSLSRAAQIWSSEYSIGREAGNREQDKVVACRETRTVDVASRRAIRKDFRPHSF